MGVAGEASWRGALAGKGELPDYGRLRIVSRASMRYVVNVLTSMIEESRSDAIDVLMMLTLTTLNVAHLRSDPELNERYAAPDAPAPMDIRRPARLEDLADMLKLPLDEARGRMEVMIADGLVVERDGGLLGAFETMEPETVLRLGRMNLAFTAQFVRELDRNGVAFDGR